MAKLTILDKKTFTVGRRKVKVQRQDEAGADKPHQVRIRVTVKGVTMTETSNYSAEAIGNRDGHYFHFDQAAAEQKVASVLKFFTTKKGSALAEGEVKNG